MSDNIYKIIKVICDKQKEEYNKYIESQPPRLNLLESWRASYENSHSRVLAKLLNPKGEHKQGDLFLKPFLYDVLGIKEELDLSIVKIIREKGSNDLGRLDLAIYIEDKIFILIENKIYASDQNNQLARYYEGVFDKKFMKQVGVKNILDEEKVWLFYLTLNKKSVSDKSIVLRKDVRENTGKLTELKNKGLLCNKNYIITPSNEVRNISYQDSIITWLESCLTNLKEDKEKFVESALIQYIDT